MDFTEKLLKSTHVRLAALAIGILSSLTKLLEFIFPAPVVQAFASLGLIIVIIYFSFVIIYRLIGRSENEKVYQLISKRYGMSYELVEVDCTIKEDGSAHIQRNIDVRAYSKIEEVDNFMLVKEKAADGKNRSIDFVGAKSLDSSHRVTITDIKKEFGRLSAVVAITPILTEGDSLEYEMIENLDAGLFAVNLTSQEIQNRESKLDYFGWNINRPTRKLIIRVFFPANFEPRWFRNQVKYASVSGFPSDRDQQNETDRLEKPIIGRAHEGRCVLTQEIDFPMIGLIYILAWRPIP